MKKYFLSIVFLYSCTGQYTDPRYAASVGGNLAPPPVLQIHNLQGSEYVKGGSSKPVRFTVTDAIGFNSSRLEYSRDNGSTWTLMVSSTGQSGAAFPTSSGVESIFNWAVPIEPSCSVPSLTSDSGTYKIRISSSGRPDAPTTVVASVSTFTVDSCPPLLAAGQYTTGVQNKGFVQLSVSGLSDAFVLSPIRAVCMKANTATAPLENDSCWRSLKALRVPSSSTPAAIDVNYFAGFVSGTFNFYLWAMDQAGNISTLTTTAGTDYLGGVVRDCAPLAECEMPVIAAALTARVSTGGSALVTKTGAPSLAAVETMIDPKYFILSANGTLYYRDAVTSSIRKINLLNEIATSTLIANAVSPVDGNETVARVSNPTRLAMDFDENLYIFDHDRIRKVAFSSDSNFEVTTIVGGGADSTTQSLTDALDLQIVAHDRTTATGASAYWYSSFEVLQNGQIYFSARDPQQILDSSSVIRSQIKIYDPLAIHKISSLNLSGTGVKGNSTQILTNLVPFSNFGLILNSVTSVVQNLTTRLCEAIGTCATHSSVTFNSTGTSMGDSGHSFLHSQWSNANYLNSKRGELYMANAYDGRLSKFNAVTLNWNDKLGTGVYPAGFCADNTSALSCAVRLWDTFVGYNEQTFFIDQGRLRFIDLDGRIKTLLQ